ncbi:hypothetical protein BDV93DRAFT_562827 [Ceratobasidium sp. AG-I]|nr:hypothetical protein BDV93DRAFT_562827 [Ceratobasidium sp. AG-I]
MTGSMFISSSDECTFRLLQDSDITALSATLSSKDTLGDGYVKMPWYWHIELSRDEDNVEQILSSGAAVKEEYNIWETGKT